MWADPFVPIIRQQIEKEIIWIEQRVKENRERLAEDVKFDFEPGESFEMDEVEIEDEGMRVIKSKRIDCALTSDCHNSTAAALSGGRSRATGDNRH